MRYWINLMEASRKPVDWIAQAQAVDDFALKVVMNLAKTSFEFRTGWDHAWANMINKGMTQERKQHEANEKEESEYQAGEGNTHTPRPFDTLAALADVTSKWWDTVAKEESEQIVADAKYEYEDYQDSHPRVEQSDEMSALKDQFDMAVKIYHRGSGTIEGMTEILNAIDTYIHNLDSYIHHDSMTRSAEDFIRKLMPAILTICRNITRSQ